MSKRVKTPEIFHKKFLDQHAIHPIKLEIFAKTHSTNKTKQPEKFAKLTARFCTNISLDSVIKNYLILSILISGNKFNIFSLIPSHPIVPQLQPQLRYWDVKFAVKSCEN